jgi:hypothetical protein
MYNLIVRYYKRLNNNVKVTNEILLAAEDEDKSSSIHSTIKHLSQLLCIDDVNNINHVNEGQFSKNIKSL